MNTSRAETLGFKIGEIYRVKPSGNNSSYYAPGMIVKFSYDDGSLCPCFTYVSGPTGPEYDKYKPEEIFIDLIALEPLNSTPAPVEEAAARPSKEILLTYIQQYYPNDATLHRMVSFM